MSLDRDKMKALLETIHKHVERAETNEAVASGRAFEARAEHFREIRRTVRMNTYEYVIGEIRKIADEWVGEAQEHARFSDDAGHSIFNEHADRLYALALDLMEGIDES